MLQAEEAEAETLQMLGIYEELATKIAAMPVIAGRKSRIESFAGANCTYTIEAMMGDKRALQVIALAINMQSCPSIFVSSLHMEKGKDSSWNLRVEDILSQ